MPPSGSTKGFIFVCPGQALGQGPQHLLKVTHLLGVAGLLPGLGILSLGMPAEQV